MKTTDWGRLQRKFWGRYLGIVMRKKGVGGHWVVHQEEQKILYFSNICVVTKSRIFWAYFFFPMALPAHSGPSPLLQFRNHILETVGLLGRVISPSQCRYLHAGQHKHSGIRTHDPSVRASENSSCLRPREYCDLLLERNTWEYLERREFRRSHLDEKIIISAYLGWTE
jgi:hypothetical protein